MSEPYMIPGCKTGYQAVYESKPCPEGMMCTQEMIMNCQPINDVVPLADTPHIKDIPKIESSITDVQDTFTIEKVKQEEVSLSENKIQTLFAPAKPDGFLRPQIEGGIPLLPILGLGVVLYFLGRK